MNEISEKPCKRCYESIPLAAHRCPKCQSWQSFWSYLANNPQMWVSLPLVLILIIPLSRVWGGGADFGKYHDQVEVTEAKLQVGEVGSHNGLVTIGWIRNHSSVKWTDVVIDVQYFDKGGTLVGAKSHRDYAMVLLPGETHAFEIFAAQNRPAEAYATQKVYVRDAHQVRNWP